MYNSILFQFQPCNKMVFTANLIATLLSLNGIDVSVKLASKKERFRLSVSIRSGEKVSLQEPQIKSFCV